MTVTSLEVVSIPLTYQANIHLNGAVIRVRPDVVTCWDSNDIKRGTGTYFYTSITISMQYLLNLREHYANRINDITPVCILTA